MCERMGGNSAITRVGDSATQLKCYGRTLSTSVAHSGLFRMEFFYLYLLVERGSIARCREVTDRNRDLTCDRAPGRGVRVVSIGSVGLVLN